VDLLQHLQLGFSVALTPSNLFYCLLGAFIGTFVGVLPGVGPVTTISVLLPFTFKLSPTASLIMLSGIYYGAHHAGSTTAIMLNMPGEPTSVVICADGHPMARQGRAGVALFIAAIGSVFAGAVGVLVITFLSPPLAKWALLMGAPEYASMIVMALVTAAVLASKSPFTTIAMAMLGILLGTIGTDPNSAIWRFTWNDPGLADGLSFVAVAAGVFAFSEVILHVSKLETATSIYSKVTRFIPSKKDFSMAWKPILRGTTLGAMLGVLPGTGPLIASFASYTMEKKLAADPSRFGKGAIEGVAGPESANNAAAITHFIPMLSLGIPAGAAMALMLGALIIQGIAPGPRVMVDHPDLFWGLVVSMFIGNIMLLILNLPMVGLWLKLLTIPYRFLYPAILLFCGIGIYSVNNQTLDVFLAVLFGAIGFIFKKLDCPAGPLVLGLILGPSLEAYTRRALLLSQGNPMTFITHPISLLMLMIAVSLVIIFAFPRKKPVSTTEDEEVPAD
jgi:putative tricarboxylic transport membrane protein